ncbi:MAG: hypothetical protein JW741_24795 [Sedimentisphaerales bacterium]|nr:hypothetical protein [Sedimentisphaerales bacterium]
MTKSAIIRFEELLELWQAEFRDVTLAQLLGLTAPGKAAGDDHYTYSRSTLRQRFGGTWWQVSWPDKTAGRTVQCKYVGDTPCDFVDAQPHNPAA